jgi:hypothetical protein
VDPETIPIRDLHLPDAVGWWPLAPGWWILATAAVAVLAWFAMRALRAYRVGSARRYALQALGGIETRFDQGENVVTLGREVSELLRRTMLAYAPRSDVAGLTGDAWLKWLDAGLGSPTFATGPGRALAELPYRDPDGDHADVDFTALVDAVRLRLATPLGETA